MLNKTSFRFLFTELRNTKMMIKIVMISITSKIKCVLISKLNYIYLNNIEKIIIGGGVRF